MCAGSGGRRTGGGGGAAWDDVVAWRGDTRFAERLVRASLDPGREPVVRSDGAYIVTGGLSGIGLLVTRWLVGHGAGPSSSTRVRSRPTRPRPSWRNSARRRRSPSSTVTSPTRAWPTGLSAAAGLTLRGIVHSAAVLDDQIVAA